MGTVDRTNRVDVRFEIRRTGENCLPSVEQAFLVIGQIDHRRLPPAGPDEIAPIGDHCTPFLGGLVDDEITDRGGHIVVDTHARKRDAERPCFFIGVEFVDEAVTVDEAGYESRHASVDAANQAPLKVVVQFSFGIVHNERERRHGGRAFDGARWAFARV